jgi:uncharacterized pyridoxamine 5'-phosphate oxidase family protein
LLPEKTRALSLGIFIQEANMAQFYFIRRNQPSSRLFSQVFFKKQKAVILVFLMLSTILTACSSTGKYVSGMEEKRELTDDISSSFISILVKYPNGVMAFAETPRGLGSLSLRTSILTFQFADGNKIYFCTNSEKSFYHWLKANPVVSYCTYADEFEPVLSFNGNVVFVEDMELKTRLMENNPYLKRLYKTPDNPVFKAFYIDVKNIETFSNEGARIYIP